jgi:hypothetical protein
MCFCWHTCAWLLLLLLLLLEDVACQPSCVLYD